MDVNRISRDFRVNMDVVNKDNKKINDEIKLETRNKITSNESSSKINIVIEEEENKAEDLVGVNTAEGSYIGTKLKDQTSEAIDEMKKKVINRRNLEYKVHEETNRIIATVKDSDTGEVVREIPSEKELDFLSDIINLDGKYTKK